jgi:hypothetical protein
MAQGKAVDVIGYGGARPVEAIVEHPSIRLRHVRAAPALPKGLPRLCFLLYAPVKVVMLTLQLLLVHLFRTLSPAHMLTCCNERGRCNERGGYSENYMSSEAGWVTRFWTKS